nr:MAG TPA: hypothetical protein [Caudoviricetes sp.]
MNPAAWDGLRPAIVAGRSSGHEISCVRPFCPAVRTRSCR